MSKYEDLVQELVDEHIKLMEKYKLLKEENEHLKSEHYKDDMLKSADENIAILRKRCRQYGLGDENWKKITDWEKKHIQKCGWNTHYEISEFPEVSVFSCHCEKCKEYVDVYF